MRGRGGVPGPAPLALPHHRQQDPKGARYTQRRGQKVMDGWMDER